MSESGGSRRLVLHVGLLSGDRHKKNRATQMGEAVRSGTLSQFTCMAAQPESALLLWAQPGESGLTKFRAKRSGRFRSGDPNSNEAGHLLEYYRTDVGDCD